MVDKKLELALKRRKGGCDNIVTVERPMSIVNRPSNEWLYRFAVLVAVSVVFLITVGALVTSTKSGDAIPDWPTSYGASIPKQMVGGILY